MQKQPEKKKKGGYVAGNKKKNRHYIIPEHDAILRTLVSALIDFYKVQNHNVLTWNHPARKSHETNQMVFK